MSDLNNTNAAADNATKGPSLQVLSVSGPSEQFIERLSSKANAARVIDLASKRIAKNEEANAADRKFIDAVNAVIELLPEGAATGSTAIVAVVGDEILFNKRTKEGAVLTKGTVVAVKPADGKSLPQYRVSTGEGFDAELTNIFPGQIVENKTDGNRAAAEPVAEDDPLAGIV